jgi:SARP family transcriptional regulator, regulator of embCAB operon
MVRFYLTGRVSIEGSRLVDQAALPGRHGRLALVRLVLARDQPLPVGELADAIWGGDVPASLDTSLRAVISKLRSAIARAEAVAVPTIAFDAGCYQLRAPGSWVDVEAAVNAVDRAEGAWRAGNSELAWSHATVAAAIARRPLLPGEDALWVGEARGRLRRVHVRALAVLAEVWRARGDHGLAVATAAELIELEPFREASHRALIAAHQASGDASEAARAYAECRRLLREELGVDPSPETERLHEQLLRRGPAAPSGRTEPSISPIPARRLRQGSAGDDEPALGGR